MELESLLLFKKVKCKLNNDINKAKCKAKKHERYKSKAKNNQPFKLNKAAAASSLLYTSIN
jgi:hypothetical protein